MKPLTMLAVAILTLTAALVACTGTRTEAARRQSSSRDNLEWFELEIDPFVFRFSVIPGDSIMYSKNPSDKEHGYTWVLPRTDPKADSVIKSLDALIRAHRLLESTGNEPEKTFKDETVHTSSVHLRIGYGTDGTGKNRRWQSFYPADNLPNNIKEFIEACQNLGDNFLSSTGGTTLTPEEFIQHFSSREKYAHIKITARGELYLNRKQASLEAVNAELTRLKKIDGGVLFYQEPPEDGSRKKAGAVAAAVMRKIKQLKLEMVHARS
jgi:hypothetical protein